MRCCELGRPATAPWSGLAAAAAGALTVAAVAASVLLQLNATRPAARRVCAAGTDQRWSLCLCLCRAAQGSCAGRPPMQPDPLQQPPQHR
ncbi:hypothetical protein BC831DRAFT_496085 [Entophlyctis helioformis]|nr:hypothetical protein BC831DRAFT_496085 [Entophlyctis helioformis]